MTDLARRVRPFDTTRRRHRLRFGELEATLADADVARLHDTLERLHVAPDPPVRRLQQELRGLLETDADDEPALDLDVAAARQVQLAVYAEQSARKPVSAALAEARELAFRYVESRPG